MPRRPHATTRRVLIGAALAACLAGISVLLAAADLPSAPVVSAAPRPATSPVSAPTLPRGGRSILPEHRVVAHYGAPQADALGILGIVNAGPGRDGKFRSRQSRAVIRRYLAAARRARALLILDVQPGRSDFVTEARALAEFLVEPDVGLALDPEWRMA